MTYLAANVSNEPVVGFPLSDKDLQCHGTPV